MTKRLLRRSPRSLLATTYSEWKTKWIKDIGALQEPMYLLQSAFQMKRLRVLYETQSPEPLRKRKLYAPPRFLEFA